MNTKEFASLSIVPLLQSGNRSTHRNRWRKKLHVEKTTWSDVCSSPGLVKSENDKNFPANSWVKPKPCQKDFVVLNCLDLRDAQIQWFSNPMSWCMHSNWTRICQIRHGRIFAKMCSHHSDDLIWNCQETKHEMKGNSHNTYIIYHRTLTNTLIASSCMIWKKYIHTHTQRHKFTI